MSGGLAAEHSSAAALSSAAVTSSAMFVVVVRTVSPVYDVWANAKSTLHNTVEEAVAACKREFVAEVRACFREAGDTAIYGVEFDPERVEEYDQDHMTRLFSNGGECDANTPYASPGGPAIAQVLEFRKTESDGSAAGQWQEHSVRYQLPRTTRVFFPSRQKWGNALPGTETSAGTPASKETPQKEPGVCPQCGSTKLDYDESRGGRLFCRDLEDPADPESEPCGWEVEGEDDDPAIRPHLVARFGYEPIDHETLVALKACKEALDGAAPFSLDVLRRLCIKWEAPLAEKESDSRGDDRSSKRARTEGTDDS